MRGTAGERRRIVEQVAVSQPTRGEWVMVVVLIVMQLVGMVSNFVVILADRREREQFRCYQIQQTFPDTVWDEQEGCLWPEKEGDASSRQ